MHSLLLFVNIALLVSSGLQAATSGSFSVLTYNVAGLPEPLSSGNPDVNTPLISPLLAGYNVINVQEDFNYHSQLYGGDNHPYRTATSGPALFGSGLNTLSDFPFTDEERVTWDDCYINEADCLTPKGFMFLRVKVSEGVWIDLYNLHADAGSEGGDVSARASNFGQLAEFMATWSAGMPVIVMGDTNTRYTRSGDEGTLHTFLSATGVTDSWIKNIRGGSYPTPDSGSLSCAFPFPDGTSPADMVACEVVDKFFIRSSAAVSLEAVEYANEHPVFVDGAGEPLSDHYPLTNIISWSLSSSIRLGDPIGGSHGTPFSDVPNGEVPRLTQLTVRGGSRVDAVSYTVQYASSGVESTLSHGGTGGTANTLSLSSGEYIVEVTGCWGKKSGDTRVFYLNFLTNLGNSLSAGQTTGDCAISRVPTDAGSGAWGVVSFWGRSGSEIDKLGVVWGAVY